MHNPFEFMLHKSGESEYHKRAQEQQNFSTHTECSLGEPHNAYNTLLCTKLARR